MEINKFKIAKGTFGARIIQRIEDLMKDKTQNGFEIIVLVKGMLEVSKLTLKHLMYISVEHEGDYIVLNYPRFVHQDNGFK
jgi:hypothetical protein